jgi:hypothetical protein
MTNEVRLIAELLEALELVLDRTEKGMAGYYVPQEEVERRHAKARRAIERPYVSRKPTVSQR